MPKKLLFATFFAVVFCVAKSTPAQSPTPATSPTPPTESSNASADAVPIDVSLYLSPTKLILAQSSERLLNTDEWTQFYLMQIQALDAARFQNRPDSPLAKQLQASFAGAAPSFNVLLDAVFGRCQAVWLDLTLEPTTLVPDFSSFSGILVSDFETTPRLVAAALAEAGFVELPAETPNATGTPEPRRFSRTQTPEIFFDVVSSTPQNPQLNACFLARSVDELNAKKAAFLTNDVFAARLKTDDKELASARLFESGLAKIQSFFAAIPQESPAAVWTPGVVELTKRLDGLDFSLRENDGVTGATLQFATKNGETAQDLTTLTEGSKKLFAQWLQEAETTPIQDLNATIFIDSEASLVDGSFFVLTYRLSDPNLFEKIKKCFQYQTSRIQQPH